MFYLWIVLAIVGAVALGASMTVIHGYAAPLLVAVLGGVLMQAGIIVFALNFGRGKPRPRRRRYEIRTAG